MSPQERICERPSRSNDAVSSKVYLSEALNDSDYSISLTKRSKDKYDDAKRFQCDNVTL